MLPYPHVTISQSYHIPILPYPHVTISQSYHIPILPYPNLTISPCCHIPMLPYPHVTISQSYHIPMLPYPYVTISPCYHIPMLSYPNLTISPCYHIPMLPYPHVTCKLLMSPTLWCRSNCLFTANSLLINLPKYPQTLLAYIRMCPDVSRRLSHWDNLTWLNYEYKSGDLSIISQYYLTADSPCPEQRYRGYWTKAAEVDPDLMGCLIRGTHNRSSGPTRGSQSAWLVVLTRDSFIQSRLLYSAGGGMLAVLNVVRLELGGSIERCRQLRA